MTTLPEAGGVAWTDLYTPEGQKISLTSRAETPKQALENLLDTIKDARSMKLFDRPAKPQAAQPKKAVAPVAEDSEYPFDKQDPAWAPDEHGEEPVMGRDWGLVDRYPPKASELKFGDKFEIREHEYKFGEGSVKFYVDGSEYPAVTMATQRS